MSRTLIRELSGRLGEEVTVFGWVNTLRLQRALQFVIVRDHTGAVQVTNKRGTCLDDLIDRVRSGGALSPRTASRSTMT